MQRFLFLPPAVLCSLLLTAPLTGCAASDPNVIALRPPVLSCPLDPPVPDSAEPVDAALYMIDLWSAGQSCREAVNGYRLWADGLPRE